MDSAGAGGSPALRSGGAEGHGRVEEVHAGRDKVPCRVHAARRSVKKVAERVEGVLVHEVRAFLRDARAPVRDARAPVHDVRAARARCKGSRARCSGSPCAM